MRTLKFHLAFYFCVSVLTLPAQKTYNLEFRYLLGATYHYKTVDVVESQQDMEGQEMKLTGGSNSLVKMEVASLTADSSLVVIVSYEALRTYVKSAILDTVIEEKELIGKRTKFIMNRHGVQTGRYRLDSAVDSRSNSLLTMSSAQNVSFFQLPGRLIGTGEKWTAKLHDSTAFGEGYTIKSGAVEYTLTGTGEKSGRSCLRIDFLSKSDVVGRISQMGMDLYIEGTSDASGTIWFDPAAGMLILQESTTIQELTFAMTDPVPMTIPLTETISTSYSLVEK